MLGRIPLAGRIAPRMFVAVALAAVTTVPTRVSAGALDVKLPSEVKRLQFYLLDNEYKNVGVLKFRVQRGAEKESFNVGRLNVVLTHSVENALVVQNSTGQFNILHDVVGVLAKKGPASYLTPEGRAKLFEYRYPLAWGKQELSADAFVTGVVLLNATSTEATVKFQVLDRKSMQLTDVSQFTVRADRSMLNDLSQGFVLKPDRVRRAGQDDDLDALAIGRGNTVSIAERNSYREVELKVSYGGQPQRIESDPKREGAFRVPEPRAGQPVKFHLVNHGPTRAFVVLAINGITTLDMDDLCDVDPAACTRWVLEPKKPYTIGQFHDRNGKTHLIAGVADDQVPDAETNPHPKLGAIEMYVFVPSPKTQDQYAGLRKSQSLATAGLKTARDASELVRKSGAQKLRPAGLIAPSGPGSDSKLDSVAPESVQQQDYRILWYADRKPSANP